MLANKQKIIVLFTQNIIRNNYLCVGDPGSGKTYPGSSVKKPDPGSGTLEEELSSTEKLFNTQNFVTPFGLSRISMNEEL